MRGKGGWQPRFRNCILHEQKRKHGGKSFRNFAASWTRGSPLCRRTPPSSMGAPTERQTAEITAAALASRVASEVGAMWTSSAYTGGASSSTATGAVPSETVTPIARRHELPVRRPVTLDPPSATPYGIFHAAFIWPNGIWNTRAEWSVWVTLNFYLNIDLDKKAQ